MSITVPSAAATTRFGSAGTIRSGSRKKTTVHRNNKKKSNNNHAETNKVAVASSAKSARIQRASKSAWTRIQEAYFRSPKQRGQDAKNQQMGPALESTISWALPLKRLQPIAEITGSKP